MRHITISVLNHFSFPFRAATISLSIYGFIITPFLCLVHGISRSFSTLFSVPLHLSFQQLIPHSFFFRAKRLSWKISAFILFGVLWAFFFCISLHFTFFLAAVSCCCMFPRHGNNVMNASCYCLMLLSYNDTVCHHLSCDTHPFWNLISLNVFVILFAATVCVFMCLFVRVCVESVFFSLQFHK